jgi:PTH1 family peptidyl-tRNA hydrolase
MKLIVGLGNPGKKYAFTRHNMGYMAIDAYTNVHQLSMTLDKKFQGEIFKTPDYILLKPITYMNLSGESVHLVMEYYNIDIEDVLIIYDDLAIPFGTIRIRQKGSDGGHNGIKSIINHLHTQTFNRVRLGIETEYAMSSKEFVLSKFHKRDQSQIEDVITKTMNVIEEFIQGEAFEKIMTKYNG